MQFRQNRDLLKETQQNLFNNPYARPLEEQLFDNKANIPEKINQFNPKDFQGENNINKLNKNSTAINKLEYKIIFDEYLNLAQNEKYTKRSIANCIQQQINLPSTSKKFQQNPIKQERNDKPSRVKILLKEQLNELNPTIRRSMSKSEIHKINQNVTSRLYNQSQIKKNYLNIIKQKAKKEKQALEHEGLTHRPQINQISKLMAEGRKKDGVPLQKYLQEEGKKIQAKRQQEMNKLYQRQIENCSFKPQLNLISQKLTNDRSRVNSCNSESKIRKAYKDSNTFKPTLNKLSSELMKQKGSFEERQRQYLQQKNMKLEQKIRQKREKEKLDLDSGQQFFKPKILNPNFRESLGSKIGDYLYEMSKQSRIAEQQQKKYKLINSTSESIVQHMHLKRISWIFSQLDSDQDNIISPQQICIMTLPPQILEIIQPILYEMEELNTELNLFDFKNAIAQLHKRLDTLQKSILYNYQPNKAEKH